MDGGMSKDKELFWKAVRYLRSLDTIPKWLIFVFATGLTWFFNADAEHYQDWHWVFFWAGIVALATYWALYGFKSNDEK